MGFYISIVDASNKFKDVADTGDLDIGTGKLVEGREIFGLIAKHSSAFSEFGDGDKRVRPTTPDEFTALRVAIKAASLVNEECALSLVALLETNPTYYIEPGY